jgi:hypothetical protein
VSAKSHSSPSGLWCAAVQVKSFRVRNEVQLADFREQLAEELGVPRKQQRLWFWEQRANDTLRPCSPVPLQAEQQQVKVVRASPALARPNKQHGNELLLFLGEPPLTSCSRRAAPGDITCTGPCCMCDVRRCLQMICHRIVQTTWKLAAPRSKLGRKSSSSSSTTIRAHPR